MIYTINSNKTVSVRLREKPDFKKLQLLPSFSFAKDIEKCILCQEAYIIKTKAAIEEDKLNELELFVKQDSCLPNPNGQQQIMQDKQKFLIIPRPGTHTPWSSKALTMLKLCGFEFVERIEIVYTFSLRFEESNLQEIKELSVRTEIHEYLVKLFIDKMTQQVVPTSNFKLESMFEVQGTKGLKHIHENNKVTERSIWLANKDLGLALSKTEVEYLVKSYTDFERIPTDVELMMFAQLNSEHCRHKHFNAKYFIDNIEMSQSMFGMIKSTYKRYPANVKSAYSDNAAVINGYKGKMFIPLKSKSGLREYQAIPEKEIPIIIKAETHNHPTGVSPYEGAATGVGGEIRDEGSVGIGSFSKCGVSGYIVSNLYVPNFIQPWETTENSVSSIGMCEQLQSSLDIIINAPLGASNYSNEFGRPNIVGFFRTLFQNSYQIENNHSLKSNTLFWGFHKPLMFAGGLGNVNSKNMFKKQLVDDSLIVVLGGPGLLIGLGGSCQSSAEIKDSNSLLDFASVQRDNAEIERRCQEVINDCANQEKNIILSIHDVGAGGLSNAIPELANDSGKGVYIELRKIHVDDTSMSPLEIWCNEAQERYVLCIQETDKNIFESICARERCPFSIVGKTTNNGRLQVFDSIDGTYPIDVPMNFLFDCAPKLEHYDISKTPDFPTFDSSLVSYYYIPKEIHTLKSVSSNAGQVNAFYLNDAIKRVLKIPAVASKMFLVSIGDKSVGGLVSQSQLCGKFSTPISNVGVTMNSHGSIHGEAVSVGEKPNISLIDPERSVRMALGESLTNVLSASIESLNQISLSGNWMACVSHPSEASNLYKAVKALSLDICPKLQICVPVGKDSTSMKAVWHHDSILRSVVSPVTGVITAYASVDNVLNTLTPDLKFDGTSKTILLYIDLSYGNRRMGGSSLAQAYSSVGTLAPDFETPEMFHKFSDSMRVIRNFDCLNKDIVLAYHDRSDGGLITTILEMCFASKTGVEINLDSLVKGPDISTKDVIELLFNEELGVVIQIRENDIDKVVNTFSQQEFPIQFIYNLATVNDELDTNFRINLYGNNLIDMSVLEYLQVWSETSYRIQSLRDDLECANEEFELIKDLSYKGLFYNYKPTENLFIDNVLNQRPKVLILREQGTNGHTEMAYAFYRAGFNPIDVHMTDLMDQGFLLNEYRGLVACGGFSFGDVLGAGKGWARCLKSNRCFNKLHEFINKRTDTFMLGICNGCQLISHLVECHCSNNMDQKNKTLIENESCWPMFTRNRSNRFEARTSMVKITAMGNNVFFSGMDGMYLPIVVSNGEGNAQFRTDKCLQACIDKKLISLQYVMEQKNTGYNNYTMNYPLNPSGSTMAICGITSQNGRCLAMMPHPERVVLNATMPYKSPSMSKINHIEDSPWMQFFYNARRWVN